MKRAAIALALLGVLAAVLVDQRLRITLMMLGDGSPPPLLDAVDEGPDLTWHDDYYIVQALDASTFAIGEPRYLQQNFNYLIVGAERAILFDAGAGVRDIRPVVEALTDQPVTFVPSHFHFDHVGNGIDFERVAVIDLPHLRARAPDDKLRLTWEEHLGSLEGYALPTLVIDEWLPPGGLVELGERSLRVIFSPGHTDDSVSLYDAARGYLFTGDFMYPGPLFAFLANSNLGDYLQGADALLEVANDDVRIFGAHRVAPPGTPEQTLVDLRDLRTALQRVQRGNLRGEGLYPVTYMVNTSMELLADPAWLQNWEPRYPELGGSEAPSGAGAGTGE